MVPLIVLFIILLVIPILLKRIENFAEKKESVLNCKGDIKLVPLQCNRVPNTNPYVEPELKYSDENPNFYQLTPKEGRFTFVIPELKYDGIFSKKNCCWDLQGNVPKTYGVDKMLHSRKNLFGKTIIQSPECLGYATGYKPCDY